ncbi:hypothetical protein EVAR_97274_1 [Eumeta japonica]|uniref:Uncharacterized protein n=1 Tax=Eumeta variegata TaxID=151549 RepID=A0A4C1XFT0_EUMVA|nr:hypothetical protein EVAR_97274_1 [Eumeta japonica]
MYREKPRSIGLGVIERLREATWGEGGVLERLKYDHVGKKFSPYWESVACARVCFCIVRSFIGKTPVVSNGCGLGGAPGGGAGRGRHNVGTFTAAGASLSGAGAASVPSAISRGAARRAYLFGVRPLNYDRARGSFITSMHFNVAHGKFTAVVYGDRWLALPSR